MQAVALQLQKVAIYRRHNSRELKKASRTFMLALFPVIINKTVQSPPFSIFYGAAAHGTVDLITVLFAASETAPISANET